MATSTDGTWLVDEPTTIDVDDVRHLKVSLVGGQVDVVAHDEPYARVEVNRIIGHQLRIEQRGGRLTVGYPDFQWSNWRDVLRNIGKSWRSEVSILVPRGADVKLSVVSANALLSGLHADAKLGTVSGEIVVDSVVGDVELDSVGAELFVRDHHGRVKAQTVSGDVTAAGAITSFDGDSVGGDIFLDVTGRPASISFDTVGGGITARLDADAPTRYSISTVGGRVHLDDAQVVMHGSYTGEYGTGDGRVDLHASTVGGNINVLRRPVTA